VCDRVDLEHRHGSPRTVHVSEVVAERPFVESVVGTDVALDDDLGRCRDVQVVGLTRHKGDRVALESAGEGGFALAARDPHVRAALNGRLRTDDDRDWHLIVAGSYS